MQLQPFVFFLIFALFFKIPALADNAEFIMKGPSLVFMHDSECPISKRQYAKILELKKKYQKKFRIAIVEKNSELIPLLAARTTTESFLVSNSRILYRGAVDDQFTFTGSKAEGRRKFLENAVREFQAGTEITVTETTAYGCYILEPAGTKIFEPERFEREIKPLLTARCLNCHAGNAAEPNLTKEAVLNKFKGMIGYVVANDIMPPWQATGSGWKNDLRLSAAEKALLIEWAGSRTTLTGRDLDTPPIEKTELPDFEELVYTLPAVKIEAHRFTGYKYFKIDLKNREDIWIDLCRLESRLPASFHHAIVLAKPASLPAKAGYLEKKLPRQGVGFHASGLDYRRLRPENSGILIPAGATFYIQAHYEPSGKTETDRLKVRIRKFRKKPASLLTIRSVVSTDDTILIPPYASDVRIDLQMPVPADGHIIGTHAHMHARGKKFLIALSDDSPKEIDLLKIDRFNFKMQLVYEYENPVPVSRNQTIKVSAWFDNSAANADNPAPEKTVRGGERADDEMIFGSFFLVSPADKSEAPFRAYWKSKN